MKAKVKKIGIIAIVVCLILGLLLWLVLPGAEKPRAVREAYALPETFESVETGTVASNSNYTLEWDDVYKTIMMYSKTGEKVWGTSPYEVMTDEDTYTSSPIYIEAVHTIKLSSNLARAYKGSIQDGHLSAKKIDNGIEVTYYFDEYEISVPVQYTLRKDSVAVSVDTTHITEGEKYLLRSITVAPYMCSVANIEPEEEEELNFDEETTEEEPGETPEEPAEENKTPVELKDSYLFVPMGNGALVSPAVQEDKREFEGEIYGTDGSRYQEYEYYKPESIKMPVFGVKDGNDAIVGIIESGAELGTIEVSAGNTKIDYSNVAAVFNVRGHDVYQVGKGYQATITSRLSKTMADETLMVGYYPLNGDKADYVGMAEKYREYLTNKGMVKSAVSQNAYALSIQGNVVTQSLAFGVPYNSTKNMTTFNDAADIIKELTAQTKLNPAVQLMGYGKSGLDIGQVAGGFGLAGVSGSKKEYSALTSYAKENNIPLFTDFDVVYFKSSGNGFNTMFDVAKTATLHKSEVYHRQLSVRAQDEDRGAFRLLSRGKLSEAVEKLIKKSEKLNITGLSFSTLGTVAYSDYADPAYEAKKGMGADVQSMFNQVTEAGHLVATDNANDYAAAVSDTVFNVEIDPRYNDLIDQYIPFYQIVFKGTIPMYSEALNYAEDYDATVLGALASGVGLGYTVLEDYDASFGTSVHTNLYGSLYSANKDKIVETVAKYDDYYAAIRDAKIADYEVLDNGVTVTTFDNGVVAYTNASDVAQEYPGGKLEANGFDYVQGGANG